LWINIVEKELILHELKSDLSSITYN